MSALFTQCPGDTVQTRTGKVDSARKFKCNTTTLAQFVCLRGCPIRNPLTDLLHILILSSWFKISKLSELTFVEKMLVSRQSQVAKLIVHYNYKLEIFSTLLSNMSVFCFFLILYLFLKLIRIAKCLKLAKSLLWSNNLPSWYIYIYNLMHLETSRKKIPVLKITYCT